LLIFEQKQNKSYIASEEHVTPANPSILVSAEGEDL